MFNIQIAMQKKKKVQAEQVHSIFKDRRQTSSLSKPRAEHSADLLTFPLCINNSRRYVLLWASGTLAAVNLHIETKGDKQGELMELGTVCPYGRAYRWLRGLGSSALHAGTVPVFLICEVGFSRLLCSGVIQHTSGKKSTLYCWP